MPGKEKGNMADLPIVTLTGAAAALGEAIVERFGSRLRGKLLSPGDAGYEEARLIPADC
jgi:NADP-dependent 3-hydroxy acid dehydrogenase YdfG